MLISFFIFNLIGILIPSLKIIGDCYYLFIVFILLLLFILAILLLKIQIKYKVIIILILYLIYKNTFIVVGKIFYSLIKLIYIDSVDNRKNNKPLILISLIKKKPVVAFLTILFVNADHKGVA